MLTFSNLKLILKQKKKQNSEVSVCAQRRIISCGFSAPHEQRRTSASLLMRCPVSEHVHVHVHAAPTCTCAAAGPAEAGGSLTRLVRRGFDCAPAAPLPPEMQQVLGSPLIPSSGVLTVETSGRNKRPGGWGGERSEDLVARRSQEETDCHTKGFGAPPVRTLLLRCCGQVRDPSRRSRCREIIARNGDTNI